MGIKIIGVKIVGLCSKCRKDGDETPKNKYGFIYDDEDISCVGCAFGDCVNDIINKEVKDRTEEEHMQLVTHYGGVREYLLSMGKFKDVPINNALSTKGETQGGKKWH